MDERRRSLTPATHAALRTEVLASLARGETCIVPTEAGYVALSAELGAPRVFANLDAVREAFLALPEPLLRLATRFWPGPIVLEWQAPHAAMVPSHAFLRDVALAATKPLHARMLTHAVDATCTTLDEVPAATRAHQLCVDAGATQLREGFALVRHAAGQLTVARAGILTASEWLTAAARMVLFVCTGNTCRSPLAEALARATLAKHFNAAPTALLQHGFAFASAGSSTYPGMPASENSVLAAQECGADLTSHHSQPLTRELLQRAQFVYCMSHRHLRTALQLAPDAASRCQLLSPTGQEIADPYGGDLTEYREARDAMQAAITLRLADWLPGMGC